MKMLLTCLTVFCILSGAADAAEPVRFARAEAFLALPVLVAEQKHFWAEEGVEVLFVPARSGKQAVQKLVDGQADIALGGTPPVARQLMDNEAFCILSNLTEADNAEKIITSRTKAIRHAEDLRGKRVGVPFGTGAYYGFREYMLLNALSRQDLTLVDIKPNILLKGLAANQLDAVVLWEPLASQVIEALGNDAVIVAGSDLMLLEYILVSTPQIVQERSAELTKILRVLHRANRFIVENPTETTRIAAQRLNLGPDKVADFMQGYLFRLTAGARLLNSLERHAGMMLSDQQDNRPIPDFGLKFCAGPLKSVAPEHYMLQGQ